MKCDRSSRSRGQRSRSQREVTGAIICQIMNNLGGDCSISIKLTTDYDHVTPDRPQSFKVNGSEVKVIAWYGVLASKNRHISWTDSFIEFKLCANYPRAQRNTWYMFKVIRSKFKLQYLRRGLPDWTQISYRLWLRHSRQTTNVQGQRSKVKVTG